MEIVSLLNLKAWKILLIAAIAVMAATLASVLTLRQNDEYETSATVFLAQVFQPDANNAGDANVTNFEAALLLPSVLDPVAAATGLTKDELSNGLQLDKDSQGSFLRVIFQDASPERAADVVRQASQNSLKLLVQQEVDRSDVARTLAIARLSEAEKNLSEFTNRTNLSDLDEEAARRSASILDLRTQSAAARASGQTALTNELARLINDLQGELDKINQLRPEYRALTDDLAQARELVNNATNDLNQAQARSSAAERDSAVSVDDPQQVAKLSAVVRSALGAIIAVLVAATAVLVVQSYRRRNEQQNLNPTQSTTTPHNPPTNHDDQNDHDNNNDPFNRQPVQAGSPYQNR